MSEKLWQPGDTFYLRGDATVRIVDELVCDRDGNDWATESNGVRHYLGNLFREPPTLQVTFETRDGCSAVETVAFDANSQLKARIFREFRTAAHFARVMRAPADLSRVPLIAREYALIEPPHVWNGNRIFARYLEVE